MTTAMPPPMQLICATASLARQAALHRDRVRLEPAPCPSASPTPCHVPFTNHTVHCTVDRPRPCPDHLHSVAAVLQLSSFGLPSSAQQRHLDVPLFGNCDLCQRPTRPCRRPLSPSTSASPF